jgi:hypothetical protein
MNPKKHPKILVKFRNSLGGYRPIEWRYLNKGWKSFSNLLFTNRKLYLKVAGEYTEIKVGAGGKLTADHFQHDNMKRSGGDFHVLYENCLK